MPAGSADRFAQLKLANRLPSPSGVALEVMRLVQQENSSVSTITRAVQSDLALTGHLIQLANSAGLRAGRPIASIEEAVQRLGLLVVRNVALTFSLLAHRVALSPAAFDIVRYWSHSLVRAIAAKEVASITRVAQPDEFFCLGLLSRIGALALASAYPDRAEAVVNAQGSALDDGAMEEVYRRQREAFGIDAAELSAQMLADWKFPALFVSIAHHHADPSSHAYAQGSQVIEGAQRLAIAQAVADFCLGDDVARTRAVARLYTVGARAGLDEEALRSIVASSAEEWRRWTGILKVASAEVPDLFAVSKSATGPERPDEKPESACRIVLVDDDETALELLSRILTKAGYKVSTARDGAEGLDAAKVSGARIVITDWQMPGIDGLSFCKRLREQPSGDLYYIIMLTGFGSEDRLAEAFDHGADEFLSKPVDGREMTARLRAARRFVKMQEDFLTERSAFRKVAAELVVANRRLQTVALTDELTGVPNRRCLMDRLEQEMARAVRLGSPLCVMMMDIDHFKTVNDRYGHETGDVVLREMARLLRVNARTEDTLGRFGGEEFVLVCPGLSEEAAMAAAERFRVSVANATAVDGGRVALPTVSIGVAVRRPDERGPAELLARADRALYAAKSLGRNRVVMRIAETTASD